MTKSEFTEIKPEEISDNPIQLIGKDWMLITSGDSSKFNMMTASWGGIGNLWHEPVVFIFIRSSRHTYEFTEANSLFSLNFFSEDFRKVLNEMGKNSGRDIDKMNHAKLTDVEETIGKEKVVYFQESKLVVIAEKLYHQDLKPENFVDKSIIKKNYKTADFHRMYVGKIKKVLLHK